VNYVCRLENLALRGIQVHIVEFHVAITTAADCLVSLKLAFGVHEMMKTFLNSNLFENWK